MTPIEIIVIIACILIVGGVFGKYVYRKTKKLPSKECTYCSKKMKRAVSNAIKEISKEID
jgi:hypothetical protein